MDYFILKGKTRGVTAEGTAWEGTMHWCANHISRGIKDGVDSVWFICSGSLTVLPAEDVIAIAPTTPPLDWR